MGYQVASRHVFGTGAYTIPRPAAAPASGPTSFFDDTFTGTNGTDLTAHTSDSGHSWAKSTGWADSLTISGNAAIGLGASNFGLYHGSAVAPSADCVVTATVNINTLLSGTFVVILARHSGIGASFTAYGVLLSLTTFTFIEYPAGTVAQTYTLAGADVLSAGETRTIAISCTGTTIKGYMDGVEHLSMTDASVAAAGRVGIRCRNSTISTGIVINRITGTT